MTPGGPGTLAIGISASGATSETIEALVRHRDAGFATVAITNGEDTAAGRRRGPHLPLLAGEEAGGVACRSFQHTLALLLALVDAERATRAAPRSADATEELLERRGDWLPAAAAMLGDTGPRFLIAPEARIGAAEQGALMFREGPRLQADACETGDWLHVDVYLDEAAGLPGDAVRRIAVRRRRRSMDPRPRWARARGRRAPGRRRRRAVPGCRTTRTSRC